MKVASVLSAVIAALFSLIWLPAIAAIVVGVMCGVTVFIATLDIDED